MITLRISVRGLIAGACFLLGLIILGGVAYQRLTPPPDVLAPTATQNPELLYKQQTSRALSDLQNALSDMAALLDNPYLSDADWKTQIDARLTAIRDVNRTLHQMRDIPSSMRGFHIAIVAATDECDTGAQLLSNAMRDYTADTGNEINNAIPFFRRCNQKLQTMADAIPR